MSTVRCSPLLLEVCVQENIGVLTRCSVPNRELARHTMQLVRVLERHDDAPSPHTRFLIDYLRDCEAASR